MKETIVINQINKLYMYTNKLDPLKEDLEKFLIDTNMNNINFSKRVLFTEEIKANDLIEGYQEDIDYIDEILRNNSKTKISNIQKDQRILNLYNGYKYILKNENINKDNLKKLYNLLSRNIISSYDLEQMGNYYRNAPVYIYYSNDITKEPDEGIDYRELDKYMTDLLEYINRNDNLKCKTDYYIKSQIIHFYFVFIHPYFDVNGRTSRTLSMWYLLNNESYPYIIFNRGINYKKREYYDAIMETKKYNNITIFLKYMLNSVRKELEKEYLVMNIENIRGNLTSQERQTINYILSMKGYKSLKDFSYFYRRFNDKKTLKEINDNFLEPLLEKNIIFKEKNTNSKIYDGTYNYSFKLNDYYLDKDPTKIKKLKI